MDLTKQYPGSHRAPKQAVGRFPCRRPGAVTVEFALVAPLAFGLILGAIELTRLATIHHVVDNAAYEAARHGMVPGATASEVTETAQQHLAAVGVSGAGIQVTPSPITEQSGRITVEITVPLNQNSWVLPRFGAGAQIQCSCTLRAERYRGIY